MRMWRVHAGDVVSAASGVLLLLAMGLDWFREHTFAGAATEPQFALNAWQTFDYGDVLLAVVAGVAMGMFVVAVIAPSAAVVYSALVGAAGAIGVGAVLVRLVAQPGANEMVDIAGGAWLGLLCAVGIGLGGWLSMRAERTRGSGAAEGSVRGAAAR
jgi:hypothetical protein